MTYVNNNNGMGSWGNNHRVADKVDHIADKIEFACDMINNASMSLDSLYMELMQISNQPNPPEPSTLMGIATRIQTSRRQIDDGLMKVKEMARNIDSETDDIQRRGGW